MPASALPPEARLGAFVTHRHGGAQERYYVKSEEPWHREAAYMLACGLGKGEVARELQVEAVTISRLMRAPWFVERVTQLLDGQGKDIMSAFKAEALASLDTLVELRDNEKAPPAVRRASAVDILNRALGTPTQYVVTTNTGGSGGDPVAEYERLTQEAARLSTSA